MTYLPRTPSGKIEHALILLICGLFILFGYLKYSGGNDTGDDLSASYIGCRLMTSGLAFEHLYKHDPEDFSAIGPDDAWQRAADQGNFIGYLHPYVQTPAWAYLLQPLCKKQDFTQFKKVFAVALLCCFALTVWSIARYWCPSLFHPIPLTIIFALLWYSQPFDYAMFLMQTHVVFFCLSILGLILAERNRPGSAGLLLAFAASVKVTPILILLYWLLTRRYKAAAYMAGWLIFLSVATIMASGLPLFKLYLTELGRLGHVLLLAQNNQSLAAWWMSFSYPSDAAFDMNINPLPGVVRLTSGLLSVGFTIAGAYLDRKRASQAPIGAIVALLAAMLFAPIAWTHYSILLLAPLMLMVQANSSRRSWLLLLIMMVSLILNYPPFASDVIHGEVGRFALMRGQFLAGLLSLAGMILLALQSSPPEGPRNHFLRRSSSVSL